MERLYFKRIKARKWAWWVRALFVVLCSVIYFWVADLITLVLYQYAEHGFTTRNTHKIYRFLLVVRENFWEVFRAYGIWFKAFWNASQAKWTLYIPLVAPLLFLVFVFKAYMSSRSSFNLWYRFCRRSAKAEDIKKMPLSHGQSIFLGRFEGKILSPNAPTSVLVWGGDGLGKTSTTAVPSILMANAASVVAIDATGDLIKFTSGHRFSQGRVFCFDWKKTDNPQKNEFWPRWNPLSDKDLPAKSEKRGFYLHKLATHLCPETADKDWMDLFVVAIETLLGFFVAKIEQACANDYLLNSLIENGYFNAEDKDILVSYYALMPDDAAKSAIENLGVKNLDVKNYLPVGSWNGVPELWKGKELCLAMIFDSLLDVEAQKKEDGWDVFLQNVLKEAVFFGYASDIIARLKELSSLQTEVKNELFLRLLKYWDVFRAKSVRERTSSSDFSLKYARGMKNERGEWCPNTVYLSVDTPEAAFMSRLMMDMLIERNLEKHKSAQKISMLFVIDDWDKMPLFSSLPKGVRFGSERNVSFLLLTNGLKAVSEVYGKNALEDMVSACSFKLLFAPDNVALSGQFRALAVFGAKSVQRKNTEAKGWAKRKRNVNDAYFYRKIADELISLREYKKLSNSLHWLLVKGFYDLPVQATAERFNLDARFNLLSQKKAVCFLDADLVRIRNAQDVDVPSVEEVLQQSQQSVLAGGYAIDVQDSDVQADLVEEDDYDDVDVDVDVVQSTEDFDNDTFSEQDESVGFGGDELENAVQNTSDVEAALFSDGIEPKDTEADEQKPSSDDDDWWLKDDAFDVSDEEENPFEQPKKA